MFRGNCNINRLHLPQLFVVVAVLQLLLLHWEIYSSNHVYLNCTRLLLIRKFCCVASWLFVLLFF